VNLAFAKLPFGSQGHLRARLDRFSRLSVALPLALRVIESSLATAGKVGRQSGRRRAGRYRFANDPRSTQPCLRREIRRSRWRPAPLPGWFHVTDLQSDLDSTPDYPRVQTPTPRRIHHHPPALCSPTRLGLPEAVAGIASRPAWLATRLEVVTNVRAITLDANNDPGRTMPCHPLLSSCI